MLRQRRILGGIAGWIGGCFALIDKFEFSKGFWDELALDEYDEYQGHAKEGRIGSGSEVT